MDLLPAGLLGVLEVGMCMPKSEGPLDPKKIPWWVSDTTNSLGHTLKAHQRLKEVINKKVEMNG